MQPHSPFDSFASTPQPPPPPAMPPLPPAMSPLPPAMSEPRPAPDPARTARRRGIAAAASALVATAAIAGVAIAVDHGRTTSGIGTAMVPAIDRQGIDPNAGTGSSASTAGSGSATTAQSVGVVDIDTVLGYESARAAGTGIVLTSSGEVLTNNHVINGATKISVTVVSTGQTYAASVVGTDPTDDVAVIQLSGASGLQTAAVGDSSGVKAGDSVTGVGNAGGVGGTPSAARGQVVALDQQLTASDTNGSNAERLTGMIEINAPIEAGDSGGPLYNAAGKIIGIDTAAQTNGRSTTVAYAVPIDKALNIASRIEAGQASSTIHLGLSGFLGVSVADSASGAVIGGVVQGGPAAQAGITAGDVITGVNSTSVTSGSALKTALADTSSGDRVTLHWTDPTGRSHSATVTLIAAPAD